MLRLLQILALLILMSAGCGFAQSVGDSEETVLNALGQPSMARTTGDRKIWVYPDGTKVVLEAGVVVDSSCPSSSGRGDYSNRAVESERPSRQRDASTEPSGRSSRSSRSRSGGANAASGAGVLFIGVGVLIILVCNVIFIIAAFSESVLWGLGVLFVPFVSLIFLFLHWGAVKKPFLVSLLVGFPVFLIGLAMLQPA